MGEGGLQGRGACGHRLLAPDVRLVHQLPERFKSVKFAKMNVLESTENRSLAMGNGVMGTPTIKVFCEGRDIGEIIGFRTMEDLENDLREILEKREDCLGKSTPLAS
jgi:thioredoxin-like negative regulator of GroEL